MPSRRSLAHDLWLAGLAWQRLMKRALKPLELTATQFLVLDAVANLHGGRAGDVGPSQSHIAQHIGLERMTVRNVVTALEKRGLLARHPSYALTWQVELEEAGVSLLDEARPLVRVFTDRYLARCNQRALREGLQGLDTSR